MPTIGTRKALIGMAVVAGGLAWVAPASAQATRTWVSGVGDDANPCSRTAPCKTFAGAISKTAAGGEINCLDPGAYGAVTITKSLSIICQYTQAGVLSTFGSSGIIINAAATDTVYIRGLDFNGGGGANPGLHGIRVLSAAVVHVQDSLIRNFRATNGTGIQIAPSGAAQVTVTDTTIADNGNAATGGGILVQPTGAGAARVTLRNVRLHNNANNQLRVDATGGTGSGNRIVVEDSQLLGGTNGISVQAAAGTPSTQLVVENSLIAHATGSGIIANGNQARVRVSNTTITATGTGVTIQNSSAIETFANNRLVGNTNASAFTQPPLTEE